MTRRTSVVIPSYNGGAFVAEAIRSVMDQSLPPREILVVDDASTDRTRQLVEGIIRSSRLPIRLIELKRNSGGPAHPMNVGISEASGEFIAVLDQDDLFFPEKLAVQTAILRAHPEIMATFSTRTKPFLTESPLPGDGFLELLLEHGNFVESFSSLFFRKRAWEEKGGFDETLKIASDFDFLCWLALRAPIAFQTPRLYLKRRHTGNLSRSRLTAEESALVKRRYLGNAERLSPKMRRRIERRCSYEIARRCLVEGDRREAWRILNDAVKSYGPDRLLLTGILKTAAQKLLSIKETKAST